MKKLVLEKIYLLSQKDRRAKEIEFHPKTNLVVGVNHTGKSSLIKNIFKTLGATPHGKLKKWDDGTISIVQFNAQAKSFKAVLYMGYRGLFNDRDELLIVTGKHEEWSRKFAEVTGFNLLITDKKELKTVVADPACFFLLFYIDQDGSWQSSWDTFPSSKRYKAPQGAILEYFAGIKPFEWYEYDAKKRQAQKLLADIKQEKGFLDRAKKRLEISLPMSGPKISPENFELEINQLTDEVSSLNAKQEELKKVLVKEKELINSINMQIVLSRDAIRIYDGDATYLQGERDKLVCPVCEAEHAENFLDIFSYAEDARVLRSLIMELHGDLHELTYKHQLTKNDLKNLDENYRKISNILETKKGDMRLHDVVSSMSAEYAFNAFIKEANDLEEQISLKLTEIDILNEKLNNLTDKSRSKQIYEKYREAYATALISLNLPALEMDKQNLKSRPALSGSGGPRQILAYYSALWSTIVQYGDFIVPIVIDSPNQQGQDHINLPKVLEFVSSKLPTQMQVIIGSEMDTPHHFDKKIELNNPYQLLDENEYARLEGFVANFTQSMIDNLERSSQEA